MKNINRIAHVLSASCLLAMASCTSQTFEEYVPVKFERRGGDFGLVDSPELLNPDHIAKMRIVLDGYHEPYRMKNGKLLISAKLKADRELTANYTQKATD